MGASSSFHPIWLSLWVATGALFLCFPLGVLAAHGVRRAPRVWQFLLEAVFLLPLVLPPVVSGLVLLLALGKNAPLGRAGFELLFTPWAAILAAAFVAFPLVYSGAKSAFESVSPELELAAQSVGASPTRVFWTISLPLGWPILAGGALLAFARGLGEFGATVMVAGNIEGQTLTAPVAIYLAAEDGNFALATRYAAILATLNFVFLLFVRLLGRRAR